MTEEKEDQDNNGYDEKIKYVNAIASPLAPQKTTKRIHKLVRKGCNSKVVKRGVKEVVKAIRKGEIGLCIIAGDISPIDGKNK
jgi:H/ACA ribonucleoprotein complex subunit 2